MQQIGGLFQFECVGFAIGYGDQIAIGLASNNSRKRPQFGLVVGMRRTPRFELIARHIGGIKPRAKRLLDRAIERLVAFEAIPRPGHDIERIDEPLRVRIFDFLFELWIETRNLS